jgi:hypothetical protein
VSRGRDAHPLVDEARKGPMDVLAIGVERFCEWGWCPGAVFKEVKVGLRLLLIEPEFDKARFELVVSSHL